MLKSEVFSYYKKCASSMESAYSYIKSLFNINESVSELCKLRGYLPYSAQEDLLKEMKICLCTMEDNTPLGSMKEELGLTTKTERFLLDDRYIIPVRDISGSLVSLIGYYPDNKKYITVPSPFFSKDVLFFNIDHAYRLSWEVYDGLVFLVEGIFDCLSLRAIGLPAIATMGSVVSREKCELLRLFRKVIYIPDNDIVGRRALNRHDKIHGWHVPESATGLRLSCTIKIEQPTSQSLKERDGIIKVKDIDNLLMWFDAEEVKEMLLSFEGSKSEVEKLDLGLIRI